MELDYEVFNDSPGVTTVESVRPSGCQSKSLMGQWLGLVRFPVFDTFRMWFPGFLRRAARIPQSFLKPRCRRYLVALLDNPLANDLPKYHIRSALMLMESQLIDLKFIFLHLQALRMGLDHKYKLIAS